EMIDSTVGGLFNRGDPADLARSVIESLNQPDARTQQAQLGRDRVLGKYTYEHNAEAYEAIYFRAIEY
ncbi:glycosyltransferase, partial [Candidatus Poseidonia alphae]|nr:glycosyltransferase [Candidatus Poseidonia alphae]